MRLSTWIAGAVIALVSNAAHATQVAEHGVDLTQFAARTDAVARSARIDRGVLSFATDSSARLVVLRFAPVATAIPFTALGGHWLADLPAGTALEIFVSSSADGQVFDDYRQVRADPHLIPTPVMPDGSPNANFGERLGELLLRPQGDGRFFRLRVELSREQGVSVTPRLRRLAFSVIDSSDPYPGPFVARDRSLTRKTLGLDYPKPPVAGRAEWGAVPPACQYCYCPTTHVAIHHTAGAGNYACQGFDECAAVVRAIQAFHMNTNGWCDIGYNYLAAADGSLWEGRGGGDDVRAAHDGFNCGSMGVANLGYFHPPFSQLWTGAQHNAVAELAAWKSDAQGIHPFGMDFYAGFGASMENIYGHRDVAPTACPGDGVYGFLPDLRSGVDDRLVNGPREWIFDNPAADAVTGGWIQGASSTDKYGGDYLYASSGSGEVCAWTLQVDAPGHYALSFWWPAGGNRSQAAQIFVKRPLPTVPVLVDQTVDGGRWNAIGGYLLPQGKTIIGISNEGNAGTVVICDAIRLTPLH